MIDPGIIDKELMEYFRELSPRDRRLMLDANETLDDNSADFCRTLYSMRYEDPKDSEHRVDNWLWKMTFLPGLYSKKALLKKALRREAEAAVSDLMLEDPSSYSDMEKTILYLEFRNVCKRYLSTCGSDRYGSKMLGLKKISADEKKQKAAADIWKSSRGIAIASGEEERLEIWCAALRDELYQYDEACKAYYDEIENNNSLK